MSYYRIIEKGLDILLRCTNINVKIIACLQASNGLNEDQVSEIEAVKSLRKQCHLLYDWMKNSHDLFNCFLSVMEENDQLHVTNFLKRKKDEPHVPMSVSRYERLIKIKPKLMDSIHYSETLLSNLEAKKAISMTDCQDVRVDILTNYKRNYILINAIQRRSNHSFICFEEALRESHQDHAADYLTKGEAVALHVNTNHPELDDLLSQSLNETKVKEYAADSASKGAVLEELNGLRSYLLSSKPGKSIVFFLYCKKTDDMALLMKTFNSGRLKSIIERMLNRLMSSLPNKPKEALEVKLRLDDEEVLLIEEFTGIEDWIPGRFHSRECVDTDDRVIKAEKKIRGPIVLDHMPAVETMRSKYLRFAANYEPASTSQRTSTKEFMPTRDNKSKQCLNDDVLPYLIKAKNDAHQTIETIRTLEMKLITFLDEEKKTTVPDLKRSESILSLKKKRYTYTDDDDSLRIKLKKMKSDSMAYTPHFISGNIVKSQISVIFRQRLDTATYNVVWGVTKLRNEIYVLCKFYSVSSTPYLSSTSSSRPVILVCEDRKPFRRVNEIATEISEVSRGDIRSSEKENCLYVSDYSQKNICVWKITGNADGQYKIIKWLTNDCNPTLSVSSDGLLLMISRKDSSYLQTYQSDANLLRSIKLPEDIRNPIHAVETSIGNFIILHWCLEMTAMLTWRRSSVWGISEVTRDGQMVIRRFIPSNETERLNNPLYLSLDSEDRVFVADQGNHRVVLLDSDLQWNRILSPTKEEVGERDSILLPHIGLLCYEPHRLCYDEEKKQLIVGLSKEVNIYTLDIK